MFSSSNSYLGIDIGSTSIKVVELRSEGNAIKLVSYGMSEDVDVNSNFWQGDPKKTAKVINSICKKAGISSRRAISALPTFSVFSSVLNLSNVTKKDIPSAVHWEAKKVIPLPLDEMILDWKEIDKSDDDKSDNSRNVRVLLTGAPKVLVKRYMNIFQEAQISLLSLETETFSLIRSLLGNDKSTIMLVEIGASTTDVSIVDNGIPVLNRSIDIGGANITKFIAKDLNVDLNRAEQFKCDLGVSMLDSGEDSVPKIIEDAVAPIVNEIKYATNLFFTKNNKKTEKVVLSGGSCLLPNLVNYLAKVIDMKVIVGDPWSRISYPVDLRPLLNEIGPSMAVAIGLAMREIE